MKLEQALQLSVHARDLSTLVGVSERQIRKMRANPKKIKDIDIPDDKLEELIKKSEEIDSKIKLRDEWYLAEDELLTLLTDTIHHFKQIAAIPLQTAEIKEQISKELKEADILIQAALKKRSAAITAAKKENVTGIWNKREKDSQDLLAKHTKNMMADEKPSDAMLRRVNGKLHHAA